MDCEVGGRASRSLRVCVGAAWGSESARAGRVVVRGRAKAFSGEWVVRLAGVRLGCGDVAGGQGQGVSLCGGGSRLSARNGLWGRRACIVAAMGVEVCGKGVRKCSGRRVAVLGREQVFGGECVVGSAGLTHFRHSGSRARVLLYTSALSTL